MSDLISRQAAIDAPERMVSEGLEWIPVYHIKELPSAQPEIVRCGECKFKGGDLNCPYCTFCGERKFPNDDWYCADGKRKDDESEN